MYVILLSALLSQTDIHGQGLENKLDSLKPSLGIELEGNDLKSGLILVTYVVNEMQAREPDMYWKTIFNNLNLDYSKIGSVRTIVDNIEILPYYNCEVSAVNPRSGVFREWAAALDVLLRDSSFQENACKTFTGQLFLHQAVLSAVISLKIPFTRIKSLPLSCGYQFNQSGKLSANQQLKSLNDCKVVIFDQTLVNEPGWLTRVNVSGRFKDWLTSTFTDLEF